jgi:hypothetical protein
MSGCSSGSFVIEAPSPKCHLIDAIQAGIHAPGAAASRGLRRRRPRASEELPIIRRGRAECGISHDWHASACHGHPHKRPRHARIAPLVGRVILGLGIDVLGPRGIVLEGRDRSDARNVRSRRSWAGHLGRLDENAADPSRPSSPEGARGSYLRREMAADEPH